jgi:2-phosphosulfolactate phosphatase
MGGDDMARAEGVDRSGPWFETPSRGGDGSYGCGVAKREAGSGDATFVARWELDGVGGVVVAIDVIRAFTTAAYAFAAGAESIWMVAEVDEAIELARAIPGALAMGEDRGRRPDAFALSNSPVGAFEADVAGRTLVQRTSAGTRGLIAAAEADRVFAASLVCASATARAVERAITEEGCGPPTYVITGRFPDKPDGGADDLLTAQLIERARTGRPLDADATATAVLASEEARRTLALGDGHVHPDDIELAVAVDRFAFAMEAHRVDGRFQLRRVDC